jgi:hypothetical protein
MITDQDKKCLHKRGSIAAWKNGQFDGLIIIVYQGKTLTDLKGRSAKLFQTDYGQKCENDKQKFVQEFDL